VEKAHQVLGALVPESARSSALEAVDESLEIMRSELGSHVLQQGMIDPSVGEILPIRPSQGS
jgi:hypothetical protein